MIRLRSCLCAAWLAVLCLAACGSRAARHTAGAIDLTAARLPYRILRGHGGGEVPRAQFFAELRQVRAVCIGETHSNPHHHWAQLTVLDGMTAGGGASRVALGMEMFQSPFQGVLDDYRAGRIDERELLDRSGWEKRWGFAFDLYRPLVELAVDRGMALLALNAPRELTSKVAHVGLEGLSPADRSRLPDMKLDDAEHRAWFDAIMAEHPHGDHGHAHSTESESESESEAGAAADRMYAAQVLWDESMAENAARWLSASPDRKVVIIAGNGHCHDTAIIRRLERRGIEAALSVRPIIDDGDGNVAAALAEPITDYLFVMTVPPGAGHSR